MIQFNANDVPGLKILQAQNIELPGMLETSGQITFDDRSTSTIISRVQGRIEQTRVSLWDNVQRGEKIVALYSPDFMTAESEYLQAHETSKLMTAPGVGGSSDFAGALSLAAKRKLQFLGMTRCRHRRLSRRPILQSGCARRSAAPSSKTRRSAGRPLIPATYCFRSARSTTSGSPVTSTRTISRGCASARNYQRSPPPFPMRSSTA